MPMWEIWNEPNFRLDWFIQPFEPSFMSMLRTVHAAIKAVDPCARVVLAGLPNYAWRYLSTIYKILGDSRWFDVVDVHPYTRTPQHVITFLNKVRTMMIARGDRHKPDTLGEFGRHRLDIS
jgi:hypothetical protein